MIKLISVYELCLGMYVHDFCDEGMDPSFWKGSFLIQTPYDLKRIKDSAVHEVWIDVGKGIDVASGLLETPHLSTASGTAPLDLTTLAAERIRPANTPSWPRRQRRWCPPDLSGHHF